MHILIKWPMQREAQILTYQYIQCSVHNGEMSLSMPFQWQWRDVHLISWLASWINNARTALKGTFRIMKALKREGKRGDARKIFWDNIFRIQYKSATVRNCLLLALFPLPTFISGLLKHFKWTHLYPSGNSFLSEACRVTSLFHLGFRSSSSSGVVSAIIRIAVSNLITFSWPPHQRPSLSRLKQTKVLLWYEAPQNNAMTSGSSSWLVGRQIGIYPLDFQHFRNGEWQTFQYKRQYLQKTIHFASLHGKFNPLCTIQSVVIFCKVCLKCSTGRWTDTLALGQ